jgi:hypothetical protein
MHIIIIKLIFTLLMRVYTQLESAPFVLDLIVSQYPKDFLIFKWHNLQEFNQAMG